MDWLAGWYKTLESWLNGRLEWVSMAMVATLLVLYGSALNGFVQRRVAGLPFVVRVAAFVALCAFGYTAALQYLAPLLHSFLDSQKTRFLVPVIGILFIAMGMLAERKSSG